MVQKKIVVISDVHLGYEHCDKTLLNQFLDELGQDQRGHRPGAPGRYRGHVAQGRFGSLPREPGHHQPILDLPESVKVHYVAGNHDYHVLGLRNSRSFFRYPIPFSSELTITDGEFTYRFLHGYEFEYGTKEDNPTMYQVMDALCRVMSDEVGAFENDIWGLVTRAWSEIRYFLTTIFVLKKRKVTFTAKMLQDIPEKRLADTIQDLDRKAFKEQGGRPKAILPSEPDGLEVRNPGIGRSFVWLPVEPVENLDAGGHGAGGPRPDEHLLGRGHRVLPLARRSISFCACPDAGADRRQQPDVPGAGSRHGAPAPVPERPLLGLRDHLLYQRLKLSTRARRKPERSIQWTCRSIGNTRGKS